MSENRSHERHHDDRGPDHRHDQAGDAAGHGHGHGHGVSGDADRRFLSGALVLIVGFMAVEVVIGVIAGSLALISDAGHMLTDAMAIVLALVAMRIAARPPRGGFTYGLRRAEIISAQANGITLLLLAAYFSYEGIRRLIEPPQVEGLYVVATGLAGIAVNVGATWLLSKANRSSLNVEGAFQHILNDLYAFIATTLAGLVVWLTGWSRADAIAALVVAALMLKAGWGLVRDAGRVFMEAAPAGVSPAGIGRQIAALDTVVEVHDLHIWEVTSGYAALSAHVLVAPGADCHAARLTVEGLLRDEHGIEHTTLQVDHATPGSHAFDDDGGLRRLVQHCPDPHGPTHHSLNLDEVATGNGGEAAHETPVSSCHTSKAVP
ncbi:cation diffusion facilitator family transporter [Nonomuraea phyllanthi]|uniref:cation diffusion facilitator family transporter n=1 Tax=Nonomuraea phyllanthi TaxID=2219224 RepID=UPI0012937C41|nr:cation diffusion facilitator family transporter [Nonomuraea phyllanthi]QFY09779.1 cation diffusion facilitator family transporter [Nonomuraea phyllanthi]